MVEVNLWDIPLNKGCYQSNNNQLFEFINMITMLEFPIYFTDKSRHKH